MNEKLEKNKDSSICCRWKNNHVEHNMLQNVKALSADDFFPASFGLICMNCWIGAWLLPRTMSTHGRRLQSGLRSLSFENIETSGVTT